MKPNIPQHRQFSAVFVTLLLFALLLIMLQLWAFVSVLEEVVKGETKMAIFAAVLSVGLFGVNLWMLRAIYRLNRKA